MSRWLNQLSGLTHLRTLDVMPETDRPEGIDKVPLKLSVLMDLRTLSLRGLALRDEDVAALARLPALPSLWSLRIVTDDPIRPETIALLKRTLPVIEYIHIDKLTQGNPPLIKSSPPQRERTPANPPRVNRPAPRAPQRRR